ncbi:MAG: hydrolase, partial [Frankiales bacterium]|nr:hydrolase [Frankiales bacterium]
MLDHLRLRVPRVLPVAAVLLVGLATLTFSHGPLATGAEPRSEAKTQQMTMLPPTQVDTASRSRAAQPVARLSGLHTPDLMVSLPHLTAAQVVALRAIKGVDGLTAMRAGKVSVGSRQVGAVAVDPSSLRPFTPRETASSDALWAAVAKGELASSYAAKLPLSQELEVSRAMALRLRVGALASFGVPGADLVVNRSIGEQLGLPLNVVVLAAPDRRIKTLKRDVREVLGSTVDLQVLRPATITY